MRQLGLAKLPENCHNSEGKGETRSTYLIVVCLLSRGDRGVDGPTLVQYYGTVSIQMYEL